MLKPEFIRGLKQRNVCKNPEKVKERLNAIWKGLGKPEREEILSLADIKKTTVERAYKTGSASAKIIAAFSQVLKKDPLYLAGINDEERPFEADHLVQFLTELGYDPGKGGIVKKRKPRSPKGSKKPDTPTQPSLPESTTPISKEALADSPCPATGLIDLSALDEDALKKIENLSEEEIFLLIRSLSVQAGFSDSKKKRFTLLKALLLQ